jgi:type I restriction-modification system DNA methylase subunit
MSPKGSIKPHNRFSVQSKRSEGLFLDYMIEHLTPTGKAGVVVPEGIHFVAQSGYTQLRRKLLEEDFLLANISLPHGVFKPYASVKTHILVIDRKLARRSDSVLFLEIENDGFSQSDTREPVSGSQIAAAKNCVLEFKQAAADGRRWRQGNAEVRAYEVSKAELLTTKTLHLLGRWHDLPNRVIHRRDIPLMQLGTLCTIRDGLSPNMATPR